MNQKRSIANWIPYLIVMIAMISLFSMNMGGTSQTLSYSDLKTVIADENVSDLSVSVGTNISSCCKPSRKVTSITSTLCGILIPRSSLLYYFLT